MKHTLRAIARLLGYPDAAWRDHLDALRDALHDERALASGRLAELDALADRIASIAPLQAEAEYVELFDRGRATALHLFEHVHGDSRERGPAMIDLLRTYEDAGLELAPGELPDHLPVLLEYASTQPPEAARELLREVVHILEAIHAALLRRRSLYAAAIGALLDLAGMRSGRPAAAADDEPPLDAVWEEPPVFGGCSNAGQAQPIRIVRQAGATGARA
ncbi:MAG: nitrate reductase molybdenum cofactor assembly chaperone [Proteobacteria bacterium]|nr:nitrate reductase molybdenum cofactor assembly chaperone [Pseudomonadota bacterium]